MRKAKKLLCVILTVCMIFALPTACGDDTPAPAPTTGNNQPATNDTPPAAPSDDDNEDNNDAPSDPPPAADNSPIITVGPVSFRESQVVYMNTFENGVGNWVPRCGGTDPDHENYGMYEVIVDTTTEAVGPTGGASMKISGRDRAWNGAILEVTDIFTPDKFMYEMLVWVKMPEDAIPGRIHISYETREMVAGVEVPGYAYWEDFEPEVGIMSKKMLPMFDEVPEGTTEDYFYTYTEGYFTDDGWVLLHGSIVILTSNYDRLFVYIETVGAPREDIYVDSVFIISP
jgi:hypothetical protein